MNTNNEIKASIMPIIYFSVNGKWGIKDVSGDVIIPPVFDELKNTSDDLNITHFRIGDSIVTLVLSPEMVNKVMAKFDMPIYMNDIPRLICMWHKQMFLSLFFSSTSGKSMFLNNLRDFDSNNNVDYDVIIAMQEFVSNYSNLLLPPGNINGFEAMSEELSYLKSLFDKLGGNVFYDKKTLKGYIRTLPIRYLGSSPISEGLANKFLSEC